MIQLLQSERPKINTFFAGHSNSKSSRRRTVRFQFRVSTGKQQVPTVTLRDVAPPLLGPLYDPRGPAYRAGFTSDRLHRYYDDRPGVRT